MTLFNPVFNRQTPKVGLNRLKTQADEGLGPQPKAGDTSRRSWLYRSASAPASKLANLFRIDVRDHALGDLVQHSGPRRGQARHSWGSSPERSASDLGGVDPSRPMSCNLRLNHAFQTKDQSSPNRWAIEVISCSVVQIASQSFLGESDAVLQPVADQCGDGL